MATRDPGWNRALEIVGQNILQASQAAAELGLNQRQFAAQMDLRERQFMEERKINAINRIVTMAPLIKPGSTVADNVALHDDFRVGLPGGDPTDLEGLGGIVLTPETWENTMVPAMIGEINALPPEQRSKALQRFGIRMMTGENLSPQELDVRDSVIATQAKSLEQLLKDPKIIEDIGRRQLGYTPTSVRIGGRLINFGTEKEAELAVRIWEHSNLMDYYNRSLLAGSRQQQMDLAKEFYEQAKELGLQITRPIATEIIQTVHEEWNPDDPASTAAHQAKVNALRMRSPTVAAATDFYLRGATLAEESAASFLDQFPGMQNYLQLGGQLKEKAGLSSETVDAILPGIARQLQGAGAPIAAPRRFRLPGQAPMTGIQGQSQQGGIDWYSGEPNVGMGAQAPRVVAPAPADPEAARLDALKDVEMFKNGQIGPLELAKKWGAERAHIIMEMARTGAQ